MTARTSEILDLAADKIQATGWGKGDETWDAGNGAGLCLEGGIAAALGVSVFQDYQAFTTCPAYKAVEEYLDRPHDKFWGLWHWNDELGRTKEEVIEVLRAAAAVERAKEESLEGSVTNKKELVK